MRLHRRAKIPRVLSVSLRPIDSGSARENAHDQEVRTRHGSRRRHGHLGKQRSQCAGVLAGGRIRHGQDLHHSHWCACQRSQCLADKRLASSRRSICLGQPCACVTRHLLEVRQAHDLPIRRPTLPRLRHDRSRWIAERSHLEREVRFSANETGRPWAPRTHSELALPAKLQFSLPLRSRIERFNRSAPPSPLSLSPMRRSAADIATSTAAARTSLTA